MFADMTMRFGEDLTTALLGLDHLFAAEQQNEKGTQPANLDRLVVLNMSETHQPDQFGDYQTAAGRFRELQQRAVGLPETDRRLYYHQVCASALAFINWRVNGLSLAEQIAGFLHIPALPAPESALDDLRREMRSLLNNLGYSGDLSAQFQAWEQRHRVPVDEIIDTLTGLLSDAWDATAAIMPIPADKSDGMRVELISAVPYNAMCDFSIRLIRLNSDPVLTRPALRHLAVHEGYPGHYIQFLRRKTAYTEGRSPADGLLSVVNTASSTPFEGIADCGLSVLGWDRDPDGQLAALLARYRSGIATRAAWRMHAEQWPVEQVRDELARDALTGGEGWVDNRIRFISDPSRAALIWSYWEGEPAIQRVWSQVRETPERWSAYFDWLYDRMHSVQSVAQFAR